MFTYITLLDGLVQFGWLIVWVFFLTGLASLGIAAALVGGLSWLFNPARSNCVTYATKMWVIHGGYLVLSWSPYTHLPHFRHSFDLHTYTEFTPEKPKHKRWFPPLIFTGRIQSWKPNPPNHE